MKRYIYTSKLCLLFLSGTCIVSGQGIDTVWHLQSCIQYALQRNLQIQGSVLNNESSQINILQARAAQYPSASATASQNFSWQREFDQQAGYGELYGSNRTSFGLSSSITLYNGLRIRNTIGQSKINYSRGQYDTELVKDEISLSILDAYIQVLVNEEFVKNNQDQLSVTEEEMLLAGEKQNIGSISQADYLQIKAQWAGERRVLTDAENQLTMSKLRLVQLMELPVNTVSSFRIAPLDSSRTSLEFPAADSIYSMAVGSRPEIKSAELLVESNLMEERIARSSYLPSLSMQGALGTGYAGDQPSYNYAEQIGNKISPSIGLNLSVPIYHNRQGRSNVERAKVGILQAELNEQAKKNELRKKIEQASLDMQSARSEFTASREQYKAAKEAFAIAQESFSLGLINSVDFFIEKTRLSEAESSLLQAKYSLAYSTMILEFYMGVPLTE